MEEKETVGTVKQGEVSKLYSQSDIGKVTNTSRDRVSRWIKKHHIKGQPAGNAILYPESVLEGYKAYIAKPTKQAKALQKTQAYERIFKKQEEQIALLKEQNRQFQETNQKLIAQNQQILEAIKANKPQEVNYNQLAEAINSGVKVPEIDYDKLSEAVSKKNSKMVNSILDDRYKEQVELFDRVVEKTTKKLEEHQKTTNDRLDSFAKADHEIAEQLKHKGSPWYKRIFGDYK